MKNRTTRITLALAMLAGCCSLIGMSEDASELTPDEMYERALDATLTGKVPAMIKGGVFMDVNWMADGSSFWYTEGAPEDTVIHVVDPRKNTTGKLFDTARLRKALAAKLGKEPPHAGVPFAQFELLDGDTRARFSVEGRELIVDLADYRIEDAPAPSDEDAARKQRMTPRSFKFLLGNMTQELLSPDQKHFAGIENNNLYIRSTDDDKVTILTDDGTERHAWDMWNGSPQWSPDSRLLAVTRVDAREMDSMPLINWLDDDEAVTQQPWSRAGRPLWKTELFIVDIETGARLPVDFGDPTDIFISMAGWLPDGSELGFLRIDREFRRADLMAADRSTGATRKILTDTQDTQLNINAFESAEVTLLDGGKRFLWLSERDGWNHIYLYGIDGTLIRRLTSGERPVEGIVEVDEAHGWVYYLASGDDRSPYSKHLYRVSLEGGESARLTETDGGDRLVHISPSKEFFLDSHSTASQPPQTDLRRTDGSFVRTVSTADISALEEQLLWSPPEEFTAKAADGTTDLYGIIMKPYDFDPAKKYPVVDYIYNGPHSTFFPLSMPAVASNPEPTLRHLGFVTLLFEGRGTSGRGKAFQDVSYGRMGNVEIDDHVAVLEQLAAERPYMDLDRVGIYGISYGGYLTLRAMLTRPDVYKVGVATAPLANLEHAMVYTEHYMGLPQNNPEGYAAGANLDIAGNLEGRLLIIHATKDVNAPFSGTMKLVNALIAAGKRFDFMILPEQPHVPYGEPGKYWMNLKHRYLEEHLIGRHDVVALWETESIEGADEFLARFAGNYDIQGFAVPVKFMDADTLILSIPGQGDFELVHENDTEFSVANSPIPGLRVVFDTGEDGEVAALRLIQPTGDETVMERK
jgi:dipeptidyl aminopeptidase/acylaminoacyl peptidase